MDIIEFYLIPFIDEHLQLEEKNKSKVSKINLFFNNLSKHKKKHSATSETMRIEESQLSGLLPIEQFYITGETGQIGKKEKFFIFRLTLPEFNKHFKGARKFGFQNTEKSYWGEENSNQREPIYLKKKDEIVELLKKQNNVNDYQDIRGNLCKGTNEWQITPENKIKNIHCNYYKINVLLVFRICNDKLIMQYRGVMFNDQFYSQLTQPCENDNKEYEELVEEQPPPVNEMVEEQPPPVNEMDNSVFQGFGAESSTTDPNEDDYSGFGQMSQVSESNTDPDEDDYSGFGLDSKKEEAVGGGRKRTRKNKKSRRKRTRKNRRTKTKKIKHKKKRTRRMRR